MNRKDLTQEVDWNAIQKVIETFYWQIIDALPEEDRELYANKIEEENRQNQILKGVSAQEEAALNLLKQGAPFELVQQILGPEIELNKLIKKHMAEQADQI